MRIVTAIALSVISAPAIAQSALSTAPAQVQEYYGGMINAADLNLTYCADETRSWLSWLSSKPATPACVTVPSSCIGQCCDPSMARAEGHNKPSWLVPKGYHYAGWICTPYGKTTAGLQLSGGPD